MTMPTGIGVIDLMMGIPSADDGSKYDFLKPLLMDRESREMFKMSSRKDSTATRVSGLPNDS